ncbi:hypothetical protein [Anaerovibrio sp.]|uniref:hypothetical protein n=1 Tax=Anaerovibrio sp. TaxID=1872532 RepID=UPI0025C3CC42|nr:hypothetical protein [Anaerovibrio sp.]
MSDDELDALYNKAMILEEILATDDPEDNNIETILAANFVDYIYDNFLKSSDK